ncbi:hypothetical protein ACIQZG_22610 [Lysinibacillus sp. NPDC096418]|uniref:hypothetical protein n=1 Tax=Lysinibacillus sp. NPDC096418 TaxID=3364138 RepID=UPI0038057765
MKESELLNQVETALNKKVDKSNIAKLNPLTKIEDNDNILVEKQHTNIFLLNFLLLVLNHNSKEITEQEYYNDSFIISKLEEETKLNLKILPFEAVEIEIRNYLYPNTDKSQIVSESTEKKETHSYFENIQFSVSWLKGAKKELDRRE